MKLLSCCKLWLYSAKIKTGNYLKIIGLFKYCFYYKFNAILKSPEIVSQKSIVIFFPTDFLIKIVF